ncbi:ATP-binding protein [Planctomyces sp. SH-PL62]|uniref:ATP-binding protein n=1 Tax=Planctomyces sp. SH-PL62 TaxID=1636152 RepID=UPI00078C7A0A|nr:ATP-binding protein [Planctomyces sp. SH-PL62]AMV38209.1 Autoinducer 2 sensor kinase/phosphatase LuxQ [Planctomyces sp. SH-PL62]
MSYRSFKHLLGETSLERKCRFIFGLGIFLLVVVSFLLYGLKTESLVKNQTTQTARMLVNPTLMNIHYKKLGNYFFEPIIDVLWGDLKPLDELPNVKATVLKPYADKDPAKQPSDEFERAALARFLKASADEEAFVKTGKPRPNPYTFADGTRMWEDRISPDQKEYQYIQAVTFKPSCLMDCHSREDSGLEGFDGGKVHIDNHHLWRLAADGKHNIPVKPGDLAGAVVVRVPMEQTKKAINSNRAVLITAALVTAVLAMVSSYMIVRYVIVKPVKHLRDVSDAIAAGRLNIRSQIQTGDEFEDLSHAFNRMLHNLVAMQQELRDVNGDLDHKVDELAQANMALYEMNRLKSDFLATMSHELRTPLNSIIGFSEVLGGNENLNERQRRYVGNIQTSGKMLLGMINDILDLAKIESGKMEVRGEDFSIRDVCEALTNLTRPMADRKDVTLECRLDEAIPLLRQDPGKIRQILYNLLSNAIKFTPEGGRVTLRARTDGRFVVLEVEDTGIGIAEEDRDTIFEKFRQAKAPGQADDVLTREHQGTGLGLSIVRELARLLGGEIHLRSQLGQGSTFTVRIPLQLAGNHRFEVNLSDERIDLSKARRIEAQPSFPRMPLTRPQPSGGLGPDPLRGLGKNAPVV